MTPYYADATVTVHHGDCLDVLATLPANSVDSVCTDPPYGLEFMGKEWDGANGFRRSLNGNDTSRDNAFGRTSKTSPEYRAGSLFQQWCELWATECLRVLKPGGHMLAFGGTRTSHRLACAIEDAGFEIRDSIAWLYSQGFPKSLDVSKAIDRAAGAERERVPRIGGALNAGTANGWAGSSPDSETAPLAGTQQVTAPATDAARTWQGWGSALKPAHEPVVVARKPLIGTVAANVLAHGTGALNIDGCRVEGDVPQTVQGGQHSSGGIMNATGADRRTLSTPHAAGRWPANVVLDESQAAALDTMSGETTAKRSNRGAGKCETGTYGAWGLADDPVRGHDDTGGASRFFYTAKADAAERVRINGTAHPTVKPLALMRWLVRLVTPPGGVVLEPFAGSGTTVEACILERFRCIAIEREADYLPLITQRINRRRDPVQAIRDAGDADDTLFGGGA